MTDLFLAILLATGGQILLARHDLRGLGLYAIAILLLLTMLWREQPLRQGALRGSKAFVSRNTNVPRSRWNRRLLLLPLALAGAAVAYRGAAQNTYRWYGVAAWLLSSGLCLFIFWQRHPGRPIWQRFSLRRKSWEIRWTTLVVLGLMLVGFYFRFWRLAELPPEMTSDHIEKLLDVHDLVTGQRPIFFVRNTGREPWQFYWTLAFIRLFGLETKFFALKLGTAAVGLLTLPGVYLLGRELYDHWVGLWATLFTAVASWPVILSRVGLRFPFAPAATVWSLLFLLRGLRDGQRNDFLLLGLSLGIGLQGYTAFRIMPLAVVVCWVAALIIGLARPRPLLRNAALTVLIALVVFVPLGRFALEHPDNFWMRSFSRMADPGQTTHDGPVLTLLKNLKDLALMFHWEGDDVWVNTLADTPVLDPLLGALLVLGLVILLWHGWRRRDAIAPLLLIASFVLLLPSALSLAYPIENPSVVRTGGAIPAVMTIAALPLGLGIAHGKTVLQGWQRRALLLSTLALAIAVTAINYRRFFVDYWDQYRRRALNTTEIATAIQGFVESGGDAANAWILAWPYWIDTRGVGIEIGDPTWNNVILETAELQEHTEQPRPRFYLLYPEDQQGLEHLVTLFPWGWTSRYSAKDPKKDFVRFYVPRFSPASESTEPADVIENDTKGWPRNVP